MQSTVFRFLTAFLFIVASALPAFAAVYDFSSLGTASGGFKPQGNRFLVSEQFTNDGTAMYYDDNVNETVNGMVIKADGTNLTSFDLGDMTISPYGGTYTVSITITADLKAGGITSQSALNKSLTAATSLTALGMNFSAFNDATELRIDLTVHASQVWNINFDNITITDEQVPPVSGVTPTVQAANLTAASNGTTLINLYWQNGDGSKRIVFAKEGNTGIPPVVDGTVYQAESDFSTATDIGGGWKCVFRDTGYLAVITGLTAGTEYRIVVYEFDGTGGGEAYLTSTATNIINHSTSPNGIDKKDFSNLGTASGGFKPQGNRYLVAETFEQDGTSMYYSSSNATETGIVIKPNGTSLLSFDLVDLELSPYDADRVITVTVTADLKAGGTASQTVSNFAMYHGIPYSLSFMGMDFSAFDDVTELRFDITTDSVYNINFDNITITDPDEYVIGTEPTVQATDLTVASNGVDVINTYWQNGDGSKRVMFVKEGNTGTPAVTDGVVYDANADFSAATDIGGGWKCVYKGVEHYAGISGLAAGTEYRMVVYEFDGSGGGENYLATTGTNIVNHATDPAGIAKYDFSGLGTASDGFKPQGNRFLVAETFLQDGTSIYYGSSNATETGIVIKPDGTNLISFDLVDMEFSPYGADREVSITVTADLSAGGTATQAISNFTMINGLPYSLVLLGFDFSAFDDVTELRFDITVTGSSVNTLNFENITLADQKTPVAPPTLTTQAVSGIGVTSATGNGTITNLGSPDPTAHGVCWNTGGSPTTADIVSNNGAAAATGPFTSAITGLTANTTYYVRAYATNTEGTSYGDQVEFKTKVALTMAVSPGAGGTTTPAASSTANVDGGVAQSITASAATGYHFLNWTADPAGNAIFGNASAASTTVTLDGSATVTANFAINTYTVSADAQGGGSLDGATPSPVDVSHGSTTSFTFNADAGHHVASVSGCGGTGYVNTSNTVGSHSYTTGAITGTCTVTATFAINTYTVSADAQGGGSLDGSTPSPVIVSHGSTASFTFNADAGYHVASVSGCGINYMNGDQAVTTRSATTPAITSDCTVNTTFAVNTYLLSISVKGNGNVTSDYGSINCPGVCTGQYDFDGLVTLTPTPDAGAKFIGWSGAADCEDGIVTVTGDINCVAEFSGFPWWTFWHTIVKSAQNRTSN